MGGAIQVAKSFVIETSNIRNNQDHYLIVYNPKIINFDNIKSSNKLNFKKVYNSPAKLKNRSRVNKMLYSFERDFNPDIVFTMFGPSYWIPKAKHVCGFADGWVYYQNSIAYDKLNLLDRLKRKVLNFYKIQRLRKESSNFILETDDAKEKFKEVLAMKKSKFYTVSNTCNSVFYEQIRFKRLKIFKKDFFNLLNISSYYPHKNLEIINDLTKNISSKEKIRFYLTLPEKVFKSKFYDNENIINLGPQKIEDCPNLYYNCDAVFLPTILETFSASYVEAMKMNKPILTSNLDFATKLCHNAAEYFNPLDIESIIQKILLIKKDKKRYNQLIKLGNIRLKNFPDSTLKTKKYIRICKDVLTLEN